MLRLTFEINRNICTVLLSKKQWVQPSAVLQMTYAVIKTIFC